MSQDPVAVGVAGMIARLREEPERAPVTFRADTVLQEGLRCDTATRKHVVVIDEPPSLGGTGAGANPMEVMLAGLAACQAITYRVWAAQLGIALDRVRVEVEGDCDLRGFFGAEGDGESGGEGGGGGDGDEGTRAGFSAIRLDIALEGPEPEARYAELAEVVDRHCPVLDQLTVPAQVTRTLSLPAPAAG